MRTSPGIDEQIRRATRHRRNGWWVKLVLEAFRYLDRDFGFALGEVRMHFRGNYVRYEG